eukprot:TRINITY_DN3353_c0_g1_i1.p1 TRINITY_DN3353_c0_g1~~TRINITY_DN3353_c0_g1_i1.p1  ORF type:complete len:2167 (-),score=610.04 TRINITY_DN3353_c0_g1_i1:247-6747(-)
MSPIGLYKPVLALQCLRAHHHRLFTAALLQLRRDCSALVQTGASVAMPAGTSPSTLYGGTTSTPSRLLSARSISSDNLRLDLSATPRRTMMAELDAQHTSPDYDRNTSVHASASSGTLSPRLGPPAESEDDFTYDTDTTTTMIDDDATDPLLEKTDAVAFQEAVRAGSLSMDVRVRLPDHQDKQNLTTVLTPQNLIFQEKKLFRKSVTVFDVPITALHARIIVTHPRAMWLIIGDMTRFYCSCKRRALFIAVLQYFAAMPNTPLATTPTPPRLLRSASMQSARSPRELSRYNSFSGPRLSVPDTRRDSNSSVDTMSSANQSRDASFTQLMYGSSSSPLSRPDRSPMFRRSSNDDSDKDPFVKKYHMSPVMLHSAPAAPLAMQVDDLAVHAMQQLCEQLTDQLDAKKRLAATASEKMSPEQARKLNQEVQLLEKQVAVVELNVSAASTGDAPRLIVSSASMEFGKKISTDTVITKRPSNDSVVHEPVSTRASSDSLLLMASEASSASGSEVQDVSPDEVEFTCELEADLPGRPEQEPYTAIVTKTVLSLTSALKPRKPLLSVLIGNLQIRCAEGTTRAFWIHSPDSIVFCSSDQRDQLFASLRQLGVQVTNDSLFPADALSRRRRSSNSVLSSDKRKYDSISDLPLPRSNSQGSRSLSMSRSPTASPSVPSAFLPHLHTMSSGSLVADFAPASPTSVHDDEPTAGLSHPSTSSESLNASASAPPDFLDATAASAASLFFIPEPEPTVNVADSTATFTKAVGDDDKETSSVPTGSAQANTDESAGAGSTGGAQQQEQFGSDFRSSGGVGGAGDDDPDDKRTPSKPSDDIDVDSDGEVTSASDDEDQHDDASHEQQQQRSTNTSVTSEPSVSPQPPVPRLAPPRSPVSTISTHSATSSPSAAAPPSFKGAAKSVLARQRSTTLQQAAASGKRTSLAQVTSAAVADARARRGSLSTAPTTLDSPRRTSAAMSSAAQSQLQRRRSSTTLTPGDLPAVAADTGTSPPSALQRRGSVAAMAPALERRNSVVIATPGTPTGEGAKLAEKPWIKTLRGASFVAERASTTTEDIAMPWRSKAWKQKDPPATPDEATLRAAAANIEDIAREHAAQDVVEFAIQDAIDSLVNAAQARDDAELAAIRARHAERANKLARESLAMQAVALAKRQLADAQQKWQMEHELRLSAEESAVAATERVINSEAAHETTTFELREARVLLADNEDKLKQATQRDMDTRSRIAELEELLRIANESVATQQKQLTSDAVRAAAVEAELRLALVTSKEDAMKRLAAVQMELARESGMREAAEQSAQSYSQQLRMEIEERNARAATAKLEAERLAAEATACEALLRASLDKELARASREQALRETAEERLRLLTAHEAELIVKHEAAMRDLTELATKESATKAALLQESSDRELKLQMLLSREQALRETVEARLRDQLALELDAQQRHEASIRSLTEQVSADGLAKATLLRDASERESALQVQLSREQILREAAEKRLRDQVQQEVDLRQKHEQELRDVQQQLSQQTSESAQLLRDASDRESKLQATLSREQALHEAAEKQLQEVTARMTATVSGKEDALQQALQKVMNKERELLQSQAVVAELHATETGLREQLAAMQTMHQARVAESAANLARVQSQKDASEGTNRELRGEVQKLQAQLRDLQTQLAELQEANTQGLHEAAVREQNLVEVSEQLKRDSEVAIQLLKKSNKEAARAADANLAQALAEHDRAATEREQSLLSTIEQAMQTAAKRESDLNALVEQERSASVEKLRRLSELHTHQMGDALSAAHEAAQKDSAQARQQAAEEAWSELAAREQLVREETQASYESVIHELEAVAKAAVATLTRPRSEVSTSTDLVTRTVAQSMTPCELSETATLTEIAANSAAFSPRSPFSVLQTVLQQLKHESHGDSLRQSPSHQSPSRRFASKHISTLVYGPATTATMHFGVDASTQVRPEHFVLSQLSAQRADMAGDVMEGAPEHSRLNAAMLLSLGLSPISKQQQQQQTSAASTHQSVSPPSPDDDGDTSQFTSVTVPRLRLPGSSGNNTSFVQPPMRFGIENRPRDKSAKRSPRGRDRSVPRDHSPSRDRRRDQSAPPNSRTSQQQQYRSPGEMAPQWVFDSPRDHEHTGSPDNCAFCAPYRRGIFLPVTDEESFRAVIEDYLRHPTTH